MGTYLSMNAASTIETMMNSSSSSSSFSPEIIVVDPPRKGLDNYGLQSLSKGSNQAKELFKKTKLLIYVSCGFDAFQRDCNALLESKEWELDHVEGHVLFPGSNAIETLAFFKSTA